MTSRKKPLTPLAQVRKATGLSMQEFSNLLKIPYSTAQAYCLGLRSIPTDGSLSVLQYRYGIDLTSLHTKRATMIGGQPLSPDSCHGWRDNCGLELGEANIAVSQLSPMIEATLKVLSQENPTKARLLLHELSNVMQNALSESIVRMKVEEVFNLPELGRAECLDHYKTGSDLRNGSDADLPVKHPKWESFLRKVAPQSPVKVMRRIAPSFGMPHVLFKQQGGRKSIGFGSQVMERHTFEISYGNKKQTFVECPFKAQGASMNLRETKRRS